MMKNILGQTIFSDTPQICPLQLERKTWILLHFFLQTKNIFDFYTLYCHSNHTCIIFPELVDEIEKEKKEEDKAWKDWWSTQKKCQNWENVQSKILISFLSFNYLNKCKWKVL